MTFRADGTFSNMRSARRLGKEGEGEGEQCGFIVASILKNKNAELQYKKETVLTKHRNTGPVAKNDI